MEKPNKTSQSNFLSFLLTAYNLILTLVTKRGTVVVMVGWGLEISFFPFASQWVLVSLEHPAISEA